MGHFTGDPLPGDRAQRRPWMRVVWPRASQPLTVLCLAERLLGKFLHHDLEIDRSRPCTATQGGCAYCQRGISRRWMGYLASVLPESRERVVTMVTENAAQLLLGDPLMAGGFRGKRLTLKRTGKGPNCRVYATLAPALPSDVLCPEFDPEPILTRMWGTDGLRGARIEAARAQIDWVYGEDLPELQPGEEDVNVPF